MVVDGGISLWRLLPESGIGTSIAERGIACGCEGRMHGVSQGSLFRRGDLIWKLLYTEIR